MGPDYLGEETLPVCLRLRGRKREGRNGKETSLDTSGLCFHFSTDHASSFIKISFYKARWKASLFAFLYFFQMTNKKQCYPPSKVNLVVICMERCP